MLTQYLTDGDFLKVEVNVNHGDYIKFLGEGEVEEDMRGNPRLVMPVMVVKTGVQKKFSLNKSNLKEAQQAYGFDTKQWIDKEMIVNKVQVRNPSTGKMVAGILLSPPNRDAEGNVIIQ